MKDIVDLRDEIAVAAMSQCLALFGKSFGKKEISVWAYEMADEMLAARYAGKIPLPNLDYSCGAAFCDDPCCNMRGAKDADDKLLYWTPQRLMTKKAEMRPPNYANLSPQQQWEVDKRLGILDWDGEGV